MLESALGAYPARVRGDWEAPVDVDWEAAAGRMPADPDVWTDGSLVRDEISGASFAGSGVYERLHVDTWRHRRWGHLENLRSTSDGLAVSCRWSSSLPGPLHTVQRAEFFGVILALQASDAVHFGVDILSVVRHVGRLLGGVPSSPPFGAGG